MKMKYPILLLLLTIRLLAASQTEPPSIIIIGSGLAEHNSIDLTQPRPASANHDTLHNRMLKEIINGNDSLVFNIMSLSGFSDFAVVENRAYESIGDSFYLRRELVALRSCFRDHPTFLPDRVNCDTLLGDTSRAESWTFFFTGKKKAELTVLFNNHQLTNFLFRKPDTD